MNADFSWVGKWFAVVIATIVALWLIAETLLEAWQFESGVKVVWALLAAATMGFFLGMWWVK